MKEDQFKKGLETKEDTNLRHDPPVNDESCNPIWYHTDIRHSSHAHSSGKLPYRSCSDSAMDYHTGRPSLSGAHWNSLQYDTLVFCLPLYLDPLQHHDSREIHSSVPYFVNFSGRLLCAAIVDSRQDSATTCPFGPGRTSLELQWRTGTMGNEKECRNMEWSCGTGKQMKERAGKRRILAPSGEAHALKNIFVPYLLCLFHIFSNFALLVQRFGVSVLC